MREAINVLFVCSMNRWRSPTAEKVFRNVANVRAAGTSRKAVRSVQSSDVAWADVIFCMEKKHPEQMSSRFPGELRYKEVHVLDIPDDYQYMEEELVKTLRAAVAPILDL